MLLFALSNALFLAGFAWLTLSGAGLALWGLWLAGWFAADYAAMWLSGWEPPAWAWGGVLAVLAGLWALLSYGSGAV